MTFCKSEPSCKVELRQPIPRLRSATVAFLERDFSKVVGERSRQSYAPGRDLKHGGEGFKKVCTATVRLPQTAVEFLTTESRQLTAAMCGLSGGSTSSCIPNQSGGNNNHLTIYPQETNAKQVSNNSS